MKEDFRERYGDVDEIKVVVSEIFIYVMDIKKSFIIINDF